METKFQLNIPTSDGSPLNFTLEIGKTLYLLGANGTGKSSLVQRFYSENRDHAERISAHRQTWFESNTLTMTPNDRQQVRSTFVSQDAQLRARYFDWNASGRSNVAIFDLIDADTVQERKIAGYVRAGNDAAARAEAQNPSPIQIINELMRLSNLPIEISWEEGQKIVARKNGGREYSVAELSDGERNAFLLAAEVLTAKPGTLLIIDEPERHLHRSIISPLLKLLFGRRRDCAFIVSTHELMIAADTTDVSTMLVRGCEYDGQNVRSWTVDLLASVAAIDEELRRDVLGARRKIVFVEGTAQSRDAPLYSLLFPHVSIVPKEGCREVEYAVRGLRGAPDMHWINAWGIVDNDQRSPENITRLREGGIWALSHYSVESLYFHPKIVARVAGRQIQLIGGDSASMVQAAFASGVSSTIAQKRHLVMSAVLRQVRRQISENLPTHDDIRDGATVEVKVDLATLRVAEEARFDSLVDAADWDGLLIRYPLRESAAFGRVVSGLKFADQRSYEGAVLKLLQDDLEALNDLRGLFGDLYQVVQT